MAEPKAPGKPPAKKAPSVSTDELLRRWESDKKSRIFLQLAEEYRKQDYVDSALSVLREGLKHHPTFQPAHVSLARCLMAKKQWADAHAELAKIHAKSPDNILAGKLLAEVLVARGELRHALQVLRAIAPFAIDDAEVAQRLADLEGTMTPVKPRPAGGVEGETGEYLTGEFETGSADIPGARREGASSAPFGQEAASPRFGSPPPAQGEPESPGPGWDESPARAEPSLPPSLPSASALPDASDVLGPPRSQEPLEPEDDFTSLTLAELYETQGEHAEAAAIYDKILSRRPDDSEIRRALARCHARMAGDASLPPKPEPPPFVKPRWQPVRPQRSAPPAGEPAERASLPPMTSEARDRAVLAELRRWLEASRAVRQ